MILAAGEGTRLGPFTHSEPKVMIPVANRPILEYVVEALVQNAVRDIVLVVGYRKERIMTHFEDGTAFDARITYAEQRKQLGTAHALLQAKEHLDETFLVLPGDNLVDAHTVRDLREAGEAPALVIAESESPSPYGVVGVEGDRVVLLVEKPEERISNLINTGLYALPPEFLDACEASVAKGVTDLPGVLQSVVEAGTLRAVSTQGTWIDAVYPWDLTRVNATALARLEEGVAGKVEEGVVLRGPVSVGEGSVVRAGTYVLGPVAIGTGCDIGPHVTVYPSTSIGRNVTVGASSVVEESVIMNDCSLGAFSYVSRSVLGKGVRAGSHLAAPSERAEVAIEGILHPLSQVGAFLGEDSVLGSGVRALPGTVLGARCEVASGTVLRRDVPHGTVVM